jgi:hypothetical protein
VCMHDSPTPSLLTREIETERDRTESQTQTERPCVCVCVCACLTSIPFSARCSHCFAVAREFAEAATTLKKDTPNVRFAKVGK